MDLDEQDLAPLHGNADRTPGELDRRRFHPREYPGDGRRTLGPAALRRTPKRMGWMLDDRGRATGEVIPMTGLRAAGRRHGQPQHDNDGPATGLDS